MPKLKFASSSPTRRNEVDIDDLQTLNTLRAVATAIPGQGRSSCGDMVSQMPASARSPFVPIAQGHICPSRARALPPWCLRSHHVSPACRGSA
eukprot:5744988-Amphidinium_carterae.1